MNLEKAFKIVIEEAEYSALNKPVVSGEKLKAVEMLKNFYKDYGYFFSQYKGMIDSAIINASE